MPTKQTTSKASLTRKPARKRAASFKTPTQDLRRFPIVGIGASAGGLAALNELLEALPKDPGMAFVIISHMSAQHESMLDALLAKKSKMPVLQAKNGVVLVPNHVYVIQPDKDVLLKRGILRTMAHNKSSPLPTVIDRFFSSLAEDQCANARAVVLSGIGSDGTLGLRSVRNQGGITFAQEPRTAQFDSMPTSAIRAGLVDYVLPPDRIAAQLLHIEPLGQEKITSLRKSPERLSDSFGEILSALYQSSGVDFSQYKLSTLRRRIARRMTAKRLHSLAAYAHYLHSHPEETQALYKESLIHVSSFFRDEPAFRALERTVLARLTKASGSDPIRVWVPGCASGEEIYSIGMLLLERLTKRAYPRHIQLFGTDVSAPDIDAARIGRYPAAALAKVSPARRKRFFVKKGDDYQVASELRDLCVFACHDVGSDPPFSKLDLVSCRNLLIYFARPLQERVIETFHYALKLGGHLFLGQSESLARHNKLFALTDKKYRIYTGKSTKVRPTISPKLRSLHALSPETNLASIASRAEPTNRNARTELRQQIDRLLIERYAPPGFFVDTDLQIISFQGDVSPYLQPTSGQADLHLSKMVPADLALDIRTAITAVRKSRRAVHRQGVQMAVDGHTRIIDLKVIPIQRLDSPGPGYLVLFESCVQPSASLPTSTSSSRRERSELMRAKKLLSSTREQLQTVIEEQENSVQELTTTHEELLSSNEELQSSNEELETAKEELQSGNEELITVNDELRKRNEELDRLTGELGNLIAGVNIAIVNLDRDRNVLRFSPAARAAFNLIESDVGRSFDHIKVPLALSNLDALIARALEQGNTIERELQDKSGRWQLLRIRPYKSSGHRIDGVLLALVDIEIVKRRAAAIIETIQEPLLVLDANMCVLSVNPAFCRTFHMTAAETEGTALFKLGRKEWDMPELHTLLKEVLPKHKRVDGFRVERQFGSIGRKTFLLSGQQIFDEGVGTNTLLIVFNDVTDREVAASELRLLNNRLREEKEQSQKRLAYELHDLSSQGFAGLSIDLARLATQVALVPNEVEQELRAIGSRVSQLANSTHELARRLHPSVLDDLGLAKALKAECQALEERTSITVNFRASSLPKKLPDSVSLCLYRIAQEALRNVTSHAKAKRVDIALRGDNSSVRLSINDNGVGFIHTEARAKGGLGLISLTERAAAVGGLVSVKSKPGSGTHIEAIVPLANNEQRTK